MDDAEFVRLMQWALPRLRMRWRGFRRVRRQVHRRVRRRMIELGLSDLQAYRAALERDAAEWEALDRCCRITISRFGRDRRVFELLREEVLPRLAADPGREGVLRAWSAGCAMGEEPYSLVLTWELGLAPRVSGVRLEVVATDADEGMLERARLGVYKPSSLRELPTGWIEQAFCDLGGRHQLRPRFREQVCYACQDIRHDLPAGPFHLVLCRNLALTYFDEGLQRETLRRIRGRLLPGGALVLGAHERPPAGVEGLDRWGEGTLPVYREVGTPG
jgi:chemotaxis protein methyltransferase CheR